MSAHPSSMSLAHYPVTYRRVIFSRGLKMGVVRDITKLDIVKLDTEVEASPKDDKMPPPI